jgi:hypothetical protein
MKHKENEKICMYCDRKFKGTSYMCGKCKSRLPLVRELIAIGKKIKAGAKNE